MLSKESFEINANGNYIKKNFDLLYKYLGVILDEKQTWKEHCKQPCCTISKYESLNDSA